MGFFDFLKKNELTEIARLRSELSDKDKKIKSLSDTINNLAQYQGIIDAKAKADEIIEDANKKSTEILKSAHDKANLMRTEAERLKKAADLEFNNARVNAESAISTAQSGALEILKEARAKAGELKSKADNTLNNAIKQASEIVRTANHKAEEIAGEAYGLKNETENLTKTITALKNTIKGYGDNYIIPSYNLLDELATDFGYTEAGQALKETRDKSRLMIKNETAASCEYVEDYRKTTAINFIIDAFNGKVDSILSTVKQDNYGTLKQKITDAYYIVNNLGKAFRNAVISPEYLDARIDELKYATIVTELRLKEREEQRLIKEQIREEEKARREFEKALREAEKEEDILRKAMEKARKELESANDEQRKKYEDKLKELSEKLKLAEEKGQKALSMAQQTKSGHVYVISNLGSFGENVYKIGMTRRLEPTDRVKELGDASVPFSFDIHAMIYSENAPALETELHKYFMASQMNKVNSRKEFFKVEIKDIRAEVESMGLQTKWTMTADAAEYRETLAIEKTLINDIQKQQQWRESQIKKIEQEELEEEIA